ncbi:LacI family DNA-binding transcriptional regulator [Oribacterium sp. WCC10]|uniref:LacI family DNA-binding transcriptional regulator n=1 Tax=Oribacterium sp. WCC10 TaxID=1855343 RepID=UPI0008EEECC5|nr:LacI family DNA-binding transcriptional regulator [Oribacterium sp. WCC10]SFG36221.1 DNA-binding transcriptional regulator, LacI/PurR family [Oribacterium sp. WCC10]
MSKKKSISVKYISEKCGVSTATISRVLNGDSRVSSVTREKVLEAFRKYNYKLPEKNSSSARKKIGVITTVSNQDYFASLLHEIIDHMADFDYSVISYSMGRGRFSLRDALMTLYDSNVSGIIIISGDYISVKDMLKPSIPHVWIDCNDAPPATNDICTVQSDQYVSGCLAARALISQNCKHPIMIMGTRNSIRKEERKKGFFDEFLKAGIVLTDKNIIEIETSKDGFTDSREAIRYHIAKGTEFDSVFAISDWRALGAYTGAISMGKRIPEDICIIGFDGISLACKSVNITSVQQNTRRLAQCSCEQLMHLINGEEVPEKHIMIPTDILPGQTLLQSNQL